MTVIDWIALAVIVLAALNGLRRGLVAGVLSLVGLAAGAYLGARIAPEILDRDELAYTPLIALGGAVVVAFVQRAIASMAGGAVRNSLLAIPPLRALDSLGGLLLGAAVGAGLVWVLGAVALHLPGQEDLRREVQASAILQRINREFPPGRLMDAIERVDPFDGVTGPTAEVAPPDPRLLNDPGVRAARDSVLRVTGSACGLGIQGSGWIAGQRLVVTNAHVVAGVHDARVDRGDGRFADADVVAFDVRNDVAVLRVEGLEGRPLELVAPSTGRPVAILGFPLNGPFLATPARVGQTTEVLTQDAYGNGPVSRTVTTLRGRVERGNSGGPAVDTAGRVHTTVFASRVGFGGGYGVPAEQVRRALEAARGPVSTGPCVQ